MKNERKSGNDFCVVDNRGGEQLSHFERLTLVGGEELVRAVAWAAEKFAELPAGTGVSAEDLALLRAAHGHYLPISKSSRRRSAFPPRKRAPGVTARPIHGLPGGTVVDLSFPSSYRPPAVCADEYLSFSENATVHARHWRHDGGEAPAIIAVHGWTMGDQRINSLAFLPGVLYQLGYDVVLFELPFHGRRRDRATKRNPFPGVNVFITNEAIVQSIVDLRDLRLHLLAAGSSAVGCAGMSLGGYLAALWGSLDELDFIVPIVPICSFTDIAWGRLLQGGSADALAAGGIDFAFLEELVGWHSAIRFRPKTPKDRVLIVAGTDDRVVPRAHPEELWRHWGRPRIAWLNGGHNVQFSDSSGFEQIVRFLRSLGE